MACANLAGLMWARFTDRRPDLWVRRALGASSAQLVRGLVIETTLLSSVGACLGIALALWLATVVVPSLMPPIGRGFEPYLAIHLHWRLIALAALLALVSGIATGLPPALGASRATRLLGLPTTWGGNAQIAGPARAILALVTAQVALSVILVSVAGLLVRSFLALTLQPTALDRDRVLLASLSGPIFEQKPSATLERLEVLTRRFEAIPGVRAVSVSTVTPLSGLIVLARIDVPGFVSFDPRDAAVAVNRVTPRFFEVFGTPLLAGRRFDARDGAGAARVAIVNRAFEQRYFQGRDAVGRSIKLSGQDVQVVGVAATAKYMTLRESTMRVVYVPLAQRLSSEPQPLRFGIRSDTPESARGPILAALQKFDPRLTVEFRTLYDEVASSVSRERTLAWSGGLLGALAVSMAAMGLYGAFSYMVTRRRSEIAIRMALGADRAAVSGMVLWTAAAVLGMGCVIGSIGVMTSASVVESLVFDISAHDPWMLVVTLAVIVAMAGAATAVPIRRAARVDPMSNLRAP